MEDGGWRMGGLEDWRTVDCRTVGLWGREGLLLWHMGGHMASTTRVLYLLAGRGSRRRPFWCGLLPPLPPSPLLLGVISLFYSSNRMAGCTSTGPSATRTTRPLSNTMPIPAMAVVASGGLEPGVILTGTEDAEEKAVWVMTRLQWSI